MNKNKFHAKLNLIWPISHEFRSLVQNWASIIYTEKRYQSLENGLDFYVDKNLLPVNHKNDLILTKWGHELNSSFHCITGHSLFKIYPWWSKMQNYFTHELKLTPWLEFPCILISETNLRRHSDKGRPTALNYPIFGQHNTSHYIWNSMSSLDSDYIESYNYSEDCSILLDTRSYHGGLSKSDIIGHRAIFNMGFKEDLETCLKKINNNNNFTNLNKKIEELSLFNDSKN